MARLQRCIYGWLLASRELDDDTVDSGARELLAYYAKRISELVALGLSIQDVGKFYLGRRPDYVPLAVMADAKKGCQPVG